MSCAQFAPGLCAPITTDGTTKLRPGRGIGAAQVAPARKGTEVNRKIICRRESQRVTVRYGRARRVRARQRDTGAHAQGLGVFAQIGGRLLKIE